MFAAEFNKTSKTRDGEAVIFTTEVTAGKLFTKIKRKNKVNETKNEIARYSGLLKIVANVFFINM